MADPIIIFDSDCVLCSRMVAFVLAHERAPEFNFVSASSTLGITLAAEHGFSRADLDKTFLVITAGQAFSHSAAGIEILRRMRPPWTWLIAIQYVPPVWRDRLYSAIAQRRYKWFGHKSGCVFVPVDQRHRFPVQREQA